MSDAPDMPMPAPPGPEHERLQPFVGTFRARVKIWMGPGDPMESTGVMVNTMVMDGRFLAHDYKGDPSPGPFPSFVGGGYWGYNDARERFEGVWVDNASNVMQVEVGTVDDSGNVWTMAGQVPNPATGELMQKRSVITLQDDDHHTMEMFFEAGGQSNKGMEISYERVS